jgi:CBS domain containing-hemolysin-like protein
MSTAALWIVFAISLLLLMLVQGGDTAFRYSFKYRSGVDSEDNSLTDRMVSRFYLKPSLMLASLRWLSLAAAFCVTYALLQLTEEWTPFVWNGLSWFVKGILILIVLGSLGFFLPRLLCGQQPDQSLRLLAQPLCFVGLIARPITLLLLQLARLLMALCGSRYNERTLAFLLGNRQLMDPMLRPALSTAEPDIRENDMKIFRNALGFSNIKVRDCIVPRTEIVAVETDASLNELMQMFVNSGKSKIIVYKEDLDHIVGYVHSSDMFRPAGRNNWTGCIREIPVVPESMNAQKMMQIFMQQKKSVAVVADEFGGTSGIISLEDLVEEIFGDIEDEHDVVTYTARQLEEDEFLLSARLETEKVNEQFGLNLPESDEYLTIGGLILFHYQDFPKPGQTVTIGNFEFKILKTSTSKIDLVKLKVNHETKKEN